MLRVIISPIQEVGLNNVHFISKDVKVVQGQGHCGINSCKYE